MLKRGSCVWVLAEAFEIRGDHLLGGNPCSGDPCPTAVVCGTKAACMRELVEAVTNRVEEDLYGSDADEDDIKSAVDEVLSARKELGRRGEYEYVFFKEDRIAVWRVFRTKIKDAT